MTRLIDADALRECFEAEYEAADGIQVSMDRYTLKCIDDAPTIDAEPVKHGEWETGLLREFRDTNIEAQEKADKAGYVRYVVNLRCSACRKITMVDNSVKYNFCPNCGAKMDKD